MKQLTTVLVSLLLALTLNRAAVAQTASAPAHPGFDLSLRVGYAIPFGDIDGDDGDSLASGFSGAVPLVLEAGYRLNPAFTLGAFFQYAFAQVKNNDTTGCGGNINCSGSVIRLGIEGLYHIPVAGTFVPWAGLGLGYEWMAIDVSAGGNNASVGARGFEFITLQGGADYRLAPNFGLGPFLSLSFARYGTASVDTGGNSASMDIGNPALHEWLQFGVRGTFSL